MKRRRQAAPARGTNVRSLRLTIFGTLGSALAAAPLSIFVVPFIVGSVQLSGYGAFATISTILTVVTLAEAGISVQIIKRIAEARGRDDEARAVEVIGSANSILGVTALVTTVGAIALIPVFQAAFFVGLPRAEYEQVPYVLLATFVQYGVSLALTGYFSAIQALQRLDYLAYVGVLGQLVGAGATVIAVRLGAGLWGLYLGSAIPFAFAIVASFLVIRRVWPGLKLRYRRYSYREHLTLLQLAAPIVVASVSNLIDFQIDKLSLSHFVGSAAAGSYQLGTVLALALRGLALAPIGLLLAGLAELRERTPTKADRLERVGRRATISASFVLMTAGAALAEPFVRLWLPVSAADAARATSALSIALLMNCLSAPWYYYCLARNRQGELIWSAAANAVVNAGISIPLTAAIGLDGALIGSISGNAAGVMVFAFILLRREVTVRALVDGVSVPFAVCVPLALLAYAFRSHLASWPALIAGGVVYVAVTGAILLALDAIPREEVRILVARRREQHVS